MQETDQVRLRHMLDAALEAGTFVEDRARPDLDDDRMLLHSLVRCIEIIGEAASQVSPEARADHPAIPWADIVSMRNRLIHAYFDVDADRVWDTVTDDLPPLVGAFKSILSEMP